MHGQSERILINLFSSLEMGDHNTGANYVLGPSRTKSLVVVLDISLAGDIRA
jgi:hypothetical protein